MVLYLLAERPHSIQRGSELQTTEAVGLDLTAAASSASPAGTSSDCVHRNETCTCAEVVLHDEELAWEVHFWAATHPPGTGTMNRWKPKSLAISLTINYSQQLWLPLCSCLCVFENNYGCEQRCVWWKNESHENSKLNWSMGVLCTNIFY